MATKTMDVLTTEEVIPWIPYEIVEGCVISVSHDTRKKTPNTEFIIDVRFNDATARPNTISMTIVVEIGTNENLEIVNLSDLSLPFGSEDCIFTIQSLLRNMILNALNTNRNTISKN